MLKKVKHYCTSSWKYLMYDLMFVCLLPNIVHLFVLRNNTVLFFRITFFLMVLCPDACYFCHGMVLQTFQYMCVSQFCRIVENKKKWNLTSSSFDQPMPVLSESLVACHCLIPNPKSDMVVYTNSWHSHLGNQTHVSDLSFTA